MSARTLVRLALASFAALALASAGCAGQKTLKQAPAPDRRAPPSAPESPTGAPAHAPAPTGGEASRPAPSTRIDPALLHAVGDWTHAQEEGAEVYRPSAGRTFAPARFRQSYRFSADGTCAWKVLSPRDAHTMRPARCQVDAATGEVRFIGSDGAVAHRIRILSLTRDAMRVAPR